MQINRSKAFELKDIPDMSEEEIQKATEEFYKELAKNMDISFIEGILKENKQLKEENKRLKEWKEDLLNENITLENIRKETIEYIKENKASLPMGRDEFTCEMRYSDDVVLAHKLLEILGDKENE